jgi:hypothetical protein
VLATAHGLTVRAHVLQVGEFLTADPGLPAVADAVPPFQD